MATSAILLGLIAFSCFQVQAEEDILNEFNKSMENFHPSLIREIDHMYDVYLLAVGWDNHTFLTEDMVTLENQTNSGLEKLHVSKTCANKAAALSAELSSDIRESAADCFREDAKRSGGIKDKVREAASGMSMVYRDKLTKQFQACEDDKCRKETTEEVTTANLKAYEELLEMLAELGQSSREGCLNKCKMDYQRRAKDVIEGTKKCVDT